MLAKNCNVVIGDLKLTFEAQELVNNTEQPKLVFKQTDVTNWKELGELFSFTEKELGAPDVVCPAAGIFEPVSRTGNFFSLAANLDIVESGQQNSD